jgi:cytochrome P450
MYEQEPIIKRYVDTWISQLSKKSESGEVLNVVNWLNFLTFDIIGDLVFGEGFGCTDTGVSHFYVTGLFALLVGGSWYRVGMQYPWIRPILERFGSSSDAIKTDLSNREWASEKALARKAQGESPGGRKDFMTYMIKKNRDGEPSYSDTDLFMNSPTIIAAGSETTATAMSGLLWYLGQAKFRQQYDRLANEIRGAFASEADIDMKTTARLPYLMATIDEILRVYPPAAETPPRVSPGAELEGEHIPKGTAVTIYQWATHRNKNNFHDPDNFLPERWLPTSHELYDPVFANDNKQAFRK